MTNPTQHPPIQNDPRLIEFKQRIGYGSIAPPVPDRGIVVKWDQLSSLPTLAGWTMNARTPHAEHGSVRSRWYFRRSKGEQITLDLVVSPNTQLAREQFLADLARTMMVEIPGELVSPPLGDLGIQNPGSLSDRVAWTFANVNISLDQEPAGSDPLVLARELQALLEQGLVASYSYYQPVVKQLDVQPSTLSVGQALTATYTVERSPMALAKDTIKAEMKSPLNHLVLDHINGQTWHWRAVQAGTSTLEVVFYHDKTLALVSRSFDIHIQ